MSTEIEVTFQAILTPEERVNMVRRIMDVGAIQVRGVGEVGGPDALQQIVTLSDRPESIVRMLDFLDSRLEVRSHDLRLDRELD